MTKYILHGGFTRRDNELNHAFFEEVVRDVPDNGIILLVYFASRTEGDVSESFKCHVKMLTQQAPGKNLHFFVATKKDFLNQIKQSDVIFFNGGSTKKLLKVLKTYPDLKPLVERKTVAGSSAGAYALVRFGTSHSEEEVREGLGLVPIRVICHYESDELPPNAAAVSLLKKTATNLELSILKDFEWKVFRV